MIDRHNESLVDKQSWVKIRRTHVYYINNKPIGRIKYALI